jgi:hypothetical protein
MSQFFMDDLDALIKSGHGDSERLSKIKAEFETRKLVTLEDRRYVEGLISRYLKPHAQMEPERIVKIPEKRIVPPPPPAPQARANPFELKYQQKPKEQKEIPKIGGKVKTRNVAIAACAIAAAIVAISYAAMTQDQMTGIDTPITKSLELDSTSYARGDIVSISGKTRVATSIVKLSITNPGGQETWTETVNVKSDGTFSTLAIAGGAGWEQAGKYTVSATYSGVADTLNFDFTPSAAN